jgi:hypothetical protein
VDEANAIEAFLSQSRVRLVCRTANAVTFDVNEGHDAETMVQIVLTSTTTLPPCCAGLTWTRVGVRLQPGIRSYGTCHSV